MALSRRWVNISACSSRERPEPWPRTVKPQDRVSVTIKKVVSFLRKVKVKWQKAKDRIQGSGQYLRAQKKSTYGRLEEIFRERKEKI